MRIIALTIAFAFLVFSCRERAEQRSTPAPLTVTGSPIDAAFRAGKDEIRHTLERLRTMIAQADP